MSEPLTMIIGSVISGIGQSMAAKSKREAEEKAKIEEEKRREERFSGIGQAVSSTNPVTGSGLSGATPERVGRDPVGQRSDRVGLEGATKLDERLGKAGPASGSLEASVQGVTNKPGIPRQPARTQLPKNQARVARAMDESSKRYQYDPAQGRIVRA